MGRGRCGKFIARIDAPSIKIDWCSSSLKRDPEIPNEIPTSNEHADPPSW